MFYNDKIEWKLKYNINIFSSQNQAIKNGIYTIQYCLFKNRFYIEKIRD